MLRTRYHFMLMALLITLTASAQHHIIDDPLPEDPGEPIEETPCFLAEAGATATMNFIYFGENITSNENQCLVDVDSPVNVVFSFHDYSFYRSYEPAPSGTAAMDIRLVQSLSLDNSELLDYPFDISVNRSTNVLSNACDTLMCLLPGTYLLTFKGIASPESGSLFPRVRSNGTGNSLNNMEAGPHHLISVTMTAYAVALEPSDGEFPAIPVPVGGWHSGWDATKGRNSVYSFVSTSGNDMAGMAAVDYFDDFGRKEESISVAATPDNYDLVSLMEYDEYGRDYRQWLPAKSQSGTGAYMSLSECRSSSVSTNSDNEPFVYPVYEPSPLNRILEQYSPGQAWHQHQKRVRTDNLFNGSGELACRRFIIQNSGLGVTVNSSGNYAAGKLQVVKTQDEDGQTVLEFKDMQDRTVLTRSVIGNGNYADTYYIYDGLGRLLAVLPPELSAQAGTGTVASDLVDRYAYLYRYDGRDRLIRKKLPGVGWCSYTYDDNDRLIFSADGAQQAKSERTFYVYDELGRECIRGVASARTPISASPLPGGSLVLPDDVSNTLSCTYTGGEGLWMGYEVQGADLTEVRITNVNYYDTYRFAEGLELPMSIPLYGTPAPHTRGLLTGTVTARLDPDEEVALSPVCDYSLIRYDDRNRVVHTESTNHLDGYDVEDTSLNFLGSPVERTLKHHASLKPVQTEVYQYTYDHMNRPLKVTHRLNGGSVVTLADNQYDALGRLGSDARNGNSLLKTDYGYNVRGWMTRLSGTLFNETLYYNESHDGGFPRWGGDISAITWKADSKTRGYVFSYDGFSRLTQASYSENGVGNGHYNTEYTYDRMGNIQTLKRYGLQDNSQYGLIDNLTYTYNGNQVTKVVDAASGPFYNGAFHFVDGADVTTEYEYDQNGNMTKDLNKNISSVEYNLLNLPSNINYSNGRSATYVYGADGKKLRVSYLVSNPSSSTTVDYCGNLIYENNVLKQILVDGGYITFSGTTPQYHFYLKDHLGNNRMVVSAGGTVEQVNHYYPYGGLIGESANGDHQRYKYNGKELDRMNGLDWLDYGARHMDGARGQFTTMDPLSEKDYKTSPYTYCGDNPMVRIDKDGKIWDTVLDIAFIAYDLVEAGTQYLSTGSVSNETKAAFAADAMAAVIPGITGAGVAAKAGVKGVTKATEVGHRLKNAKAIAEGKLFEKTEIAATKASGENVAGQIRLVPKNGIGNIKGNRSTADQLIKKSNGKFKIVETKLRKGSSKLSKGQKATKEHVESGSQDFEVRSENSDLGINKGQTIKVDEYEIKYKYQK